MVKPGDVITDGSVKWTAREIGRDKNPVDTNPVGTILAFAGNNVLPAGYLWCDGSAIGRSNYPALWATIGGRYGVGNGSTTFNLPNITDGRMISSPYANNNQVGVYYNPGIPSITGTSTVISGEIGGSPVQGMSGSGAFTKAASGTSTQYYDVHNDPDGNVRQQYVLRLNGTVQTTLSGGVYGASTTVQPKAVTVRFIIKY